MASGPVVGTQVNPLKSRRRPSIGRQRLQQELPSDMMRGRTRARPARQEVEQHTPSRFQSRRPLEPRCGRCRGPAHDSIGGPRARIYRRSYVSAKPQICGVTNPYDLLGRRRVEVTVAGAAARTRGSCEQREYESCQCRKTSFMPMSPVVRVEGSEALVRGAGNGRGDSPPPTGRPIAVRSATLARVCLMS